MLDFPSWFDTMLPGIACPECEDFIRKENIVAVGIRNSKKNNKVTSFFVEHVCKKCGFFAILELSNMSIKDYINDMNEVFLGKKIKTIMDKNNKSRITQEEFDNIKKFLKGCKYHEDFMLEIGMTREQIDKPINDLKKEKGK